MTDAMQSQPWRKNKSACLNLRGREIKWPSSSPKLQVQNGMWNSTFYNPKEHGRPVQLQFAHGMRGLMDEPPPDTN
jgi:hypothetical protein